MKCKYIFTAKALMKLYDNDLSHPQKKTTGAAFVLTYYLKPKTYNLFHPQQFHLKNEVSIRFYHTTCTSATIG